MQDYTKFSIANLQCLYFWHFLSFWRFLIFKRKDISFTAVKQVCFDHFIVRCVL